MPVERLVATPRGDARLVVRRAKRPVAGLVLTHGAGGGIDARVGELRDDVTASQTAEIARMQDLLDEL